MYSVPDRVSLETCGRSALRRGFFSGMALVDSNGQTYAVREVSEAGTAGPFSGLRLLKSRRIRLSLELELGRKMDLPEVVALVTQAIERFPRQWEAVESTTDTTGRVRRQLSIREVVELFLGQR